MNVIEGMRPIDSDGIEYDAGDVVCYYSHKQKRIVSAKVMSITAIETLRINETLGGYVKHRLNVRLLEPPKDGLSRVTLGNPRRHRILCKLVQKTP